MSEKVFKVECPSNFYLWKKNILAKDKLRIIGEFPHRLEILQSLGLQNSSLADSFMITDEEEIIARQDLLWFFAQNPEIRQWIKNCRIEIDLPTSQNHFLSFFDPKQDHNPYWKKIHRFIGLFDKAQGVVPQRLQTIVDWAKKHLPLEQDEKRTGEELFKRIEKIALIEGLLCFKIENNGYTILPISDQSYVFGYCAFSSKLNRWKRWIPKNSLLEYILAVFNVFIESQQRKIMKTLVIDKPTDPIKEDVKRGLRALLAKIREHGDLGLDKISCKVFFRYSNKGLEAQLYKVEDNSFLQNKNTFNFGDYKGYPWNMRKQIENMQEKYHREVDEFHQNLKAARLMVKTEGVDEWFFRKLFAVPSPEMDKEYRWIDLKSIYENEFDNVVKNLRRHRNFFTEQIGMLRNIVSIAKRYCDLAEKFQWPLCKPEIISNGHVVGFDKVYPVFLLQRMKSEKIDPIKNLPLLNGNAIGLGGVHEGGKTTTGLKLAELIFEAQSGLLCFGQGIKTNIKQTLALIFIPRGTSGSLASQLLDQILLIMQEIEKQKSNNILVILDELGGGTQAVSGRDFGVALVRTLMQKKISTFFNSQITELFSDLQKQGVQCFQIDCDHTIREGIGTGQFPELVRRKGLDKYLIKTPK